MKKFKIFVLTLAILLTFSAVSPCVFADHKTGAELFGGVDKKKSDQEKLQAIYDDLILRIYEFDEDILLPNFEDMNDLDDIVYKHIKSKYGRERGQSMYIEPDGEARWVARDGALVIVYAKYKDYSLVELMVDEDESEGTIAWVPTTYVKK